MNFTKEEAKQKIVELIEKYQKLTAKEIKSINEEATKQGFIQPMFRALGWDFENTNEVSPEEHASNGRVDYAFKLNNVSQFYIEAKSLKADLNREDYIKQSVSYSYARGVTWAVLTDFESLRVFNALQNKPFISLSCLEYVNHFDDLWLLSRQAFTDNELNKKAQAYGAMPPFIPIEKRLFKQLSLWRENLFNEIYRYNEEKKLDREQVDGMIQKLFNRLIFIRTCEDRRIEENGIRALLNQWKTGGSKGYLSKPLRALFQEYEGYYDSELFSHHLLDEDIFIDNESLQPVLEGLYEIPGSLASYNFNDIDADVLGAVYEQYLGHIAEVVKKQAKNAQTRMSLGIETPTFKLADKKEHRKEHGIYYTPRYITDYIVKETVGRFLQENTGYPDKLHNLKILDPACGSGSFLIRAYDELLNYHGNELKKPVHELDQWERLPILTNNIFGVDLDKQAVEVARLNLLLRSLAKREPLPYLGNNIKNGNSLISGNEAELKKYFGDDWKDKNPFNWDDEFKDIMKNGGFDIVIGNPPYVRIQSLPRDEAEYYRQLYSSAYGSFDIYVLFIERGIKSLRNGGRLGFITSGKFLKTGYGKKIQELIYKECMVETILDLSQQQVFSEATTYPVILIIKKGVERKLLNYSIVSGDNEIGMNLDVSSLPVIKTDQDAIIKGVWPPSINNQKIMQILENNSFPLNKVTQRIFQGLKTGADDIYTLKLIRQEEQGVLVYSNVLDRQIVIEKEITKPLIKIGEMCRYYIAKPDKVIIFPYENGKLFSEDVMNKIYPKCWQYLLSNRNVLAQRERGLFEKEDWYQFSRNQALQTMHLNKIITPDFAPNARYSLDSLGEYCFSGGTAGGYGIIVSNGFNSMYLLSLLNSKLLDWYLHNISSAFRGQWFSYESRYIQRLPIHVIDLNNQDQITKHDSLVFLAENMLELNKKLHSMTEYEIDKKQQLEKEIKDMDEKIDNLVYHLYGLTEEEIKIVEGETNTK